MSTTSETSLAEQVTLLELVDRVVNKGVVLTGDITLSVAGVDLIYLGLRVLLSSVDTLDRLEAERAEELLAGAAP
jgi:gas vesicle structural protein